MCRLRDGFPTNRTSSQFAVPIGNVVEKVTVEMIEIGWRLTDGNGTQEAVAELPEDDEPPLDAL